MIGVYKIENLINGKIYIGQSIHIERRWKEHCIPSSKSLIGKAIKKYGKENFSFQVLNECAQENLDELEEYYISKYNSITPNGYNIETAAKGKTSFSFYDIKIFSDIVNDIVNSELTLTAIAEKYDLSRRTVQRINHGEVHYQKDFVYPLRDTKNKNAARKDTFCVDCGKKITYQAKRCASCAQKAQQRCIRPSREELKELIRTKSFVEIGRRYSVSDNAIRKWCKKEGLPSKRRDINSYSDEEWENI